MRIHGDLIEIRILELADTGRLHRYRLENRMFLQPFEPLQSEESYTMEATRDSIVQMEAEQERGNSYAFGIFLADELIGRIRLSSIVRGPWQNANLGYAISEKLNGQGYMTEAVKLVLGFAFKEAGLHRVQAAVMPRNLGSLRVMEKNGLRLEGLAQRYLNINGVWEDHAIYAITAEEWK